MFITNRLLGIAISYSSRFHTACLMFSTSISKHSTRLKQHLLQQHRGRAPATAHLEQRHLVVFWGGGVAPHQVPLVLCARRARFDAAIYTIEALEVELKGFVIISLVFEKCVSHLHTGRNYSSCSHLRANADLPSAALSSTTSLFTCFYSSVNVLFISSKKLQRAQSLLLSNTN